jgi:RNA polymerase sigma-B factor
VSLEDLFVEYHRTRQRALRNRLIEAHRGLAEFFVRRYSRRGIPDDDLRQIALLAILHAVERFDPSLGVSFATFASRTIEGELKRYFRDRTWLVRPPRRAQELHLELRSSIDALTQRLGRSPTVPELAAELRVDEDRILEALEAGAAHQTASLDETVSFADGVSRELKRPLAHVDPGFAATDHRLVLDQVLDGLPERERTVIYLRFVEGLGQQEIADRIGVSQSYLSRILRRSLIRLRSRIAPQER